MNHSPVFVTSSIGVIDVLVEKYDFAILKRFSYAERIANNSVNSIPCKTQSSTENVKTAPFVIYTLSYLFRVLFFDLSAE